MQITNIQIATMLCKRQIKVVNYAIKNNIPPNDIRCNRLLEKLIVKEQQYINADNKEAQMRSFEVLGMIRKKLYG